MRKRLESEFEKIDSYKLTRESMDSLEQGRLASYKLPRGGYRFYFICPKCKRQKRFLYRGVILACRDCLGLAYESSQRKNRYYRVWKYLSGIKSEYKQFRPTKKPKPIYNLEPDSLPSDTKTLIALIEYLYQ